MGCDRSTVRVGVMIATLGGTGCGDEVVGFFDGSSGGESTTTDPISTVTSGDGTTSSTTSMATTTSADDTSTTAPSETGDTGFVAPGCFGDDFENDVIDALWNQWIEEDAELVEASGMLKMTPPTFGVWDTGVVGAYNYVFPFHDGHARVRVPMPPATSRPVLLWLSVNEDLTGISLAMHMANGVVTVLGSIGEVEQYREDIPMDPYPAWMQIRAEGAMAHFETSDDGITFTTLTTRDKLGAFDAAVGLLMAQTYGDDPEHTAVWVDDFEVCVQ